MAAKKPERFALRVVKGGFQPADAYTANRLREKGYRVNDVIMAQLTAIRSPKFHRLAHVFGKMCVDNIEGFERMNAHTALKRLQWESGVGCEEMGVMVPGIGYTTIRIPNSLSFASMDEGEFREVFGGLCGHVAETYWPDLTQEQVEQIAETMPEA